MAVAMTEEMSVSLQKNLADWWSEETDYVFQRIERWAALARGYNRLRSQRLSRGRLTMQEEQEPRWTIAANRLVIDDPTWAPRFRDFKRTHRRKSRTDENCRINCCASGSGFDYRSNGSLDSACLESYRYDHSIYFKTIGDIRSSRKSSEAGGSENNDAGASSFGDERLEGWEDKIDSGNSGSNFLNDDNEEEAEEDDDDGQFDELARENGNFRFSVTEFRRDVDEDDERVANAWPIVDLARLSLNAAAGDRRSDTGSEDDNNNNNDNSGSNNNGDYEDCNEESGDPIRKVIQLQIDEFANSCSNKVGTDSSMQSLSPSRNSRDETASRASSFRKQRRSPRRVKQPTLAGDNNVVWPSVLLNYTKNIDPATSPHHRHAVDVK